MTNEETYANLVGEEMVAITNQNGSITSLPKSVFDNLSIEELKSKGAV